MLDFLRDTSFAGPAFPEPFVQFELEKELAKSNLLPIITGSEGRELAALWGMYRRKIRGLISGGSIRVRNHVIDPLQQRLGYERLVPGGEIRTREGAEDGGDLVVATDGSKLRVWCTEYDEDLDAPTQRGAAYRFSHLQVARRVLKAQQERIGLLTNGTELRIIILDLARTDSEINIRLDPSWKDPRAFEVSDSFLLLLALASPAGVRALPELLDKARLQQARVTKELRAQARKAVEGFLQGVLDHPENQTKLGDLTARHGRAQELWREALIVVYRLLFILKLEATDDPARSFKFSTSTLWRHTFSPTSALPRFVRKLLDEGAVSGNLLEQSLRKLFQMFVDGLECSELHVRPLGGTLFGREATPLLSDLKWGERGVATLLDQLLWTTPRQGPSGRERVHYGSLDVEDLGRVYEALLELEPGVATEDMCRLRRSKLEVVVPVAQGERYRPTDNSADAMQDVDNDEPEEEVEEEESEELARRKGTKVQWIERISASQFYLRVGLGRKASGSYYTPQSFVRFLVQQTLEPIATARSPKEDPKPAEILKIKVLDPAMGSGHFLVEACRFLAAKLYEAARLCDERLAQAVRTVEAAQNDEIRKEAQRHADIYRQRLSDFLPPEAKLPGYLPSRAPEAGESSGISQKHAEATCRRLIAIHCLYGVDKNPLGVELAKVALWLESHSEGFPLTFLDHRLVLGDSIVGPFLDHLLIFPGSKGRMDDLLTQGLREKLAAAMNKAIVSVLEIESTLCSTMPDFESKTQLRKQMETALTPFKVVAAAWAGGVMLGEGCDDDAYANLIRTVASTGNLAEQLDSEGLRDMIGYGLGVGRVPKFSSELIDWLRSGGCVPALPFDFVFPDVFFRTGDVRSRSGFDVILGNPPWDRMLPADKEFFASYDFSILQAQTKQERTDVRRRLLAIPSIQASYERYVQQFRGTERMLDQIYEYQTVEVDGERTIGKQDAFRVFLERNSQLLASTGATGVLVPSGFHANEGATGVRRLYLEKMNLKCCYSFENRRKLFEIHSSFKFAVIIALRQGPTTEFSCAFYLHDDEWLFSEVREPRPLTYTLGFVQQTGGGYVTLLELRSAADFRIAQVMFNNGEAFGAVCRREGLRLARELNMSDDAWRFTPTADILQPSEDPRDPNTGKLLLANGCVVVHEGKTFHQFTDRWDARPRNLVRLTTLRDKPEILDALSYFRIGIREVSSATNERTLIATVLPPATTSGHTVTHERSPRLRPNSAILSIVAQLNSYPTDWCVRLNAASHVTRFALDLMPVAPARKTFLAHGAARLVCNHSGYEPLWREQLGNNWREPGPSFTWPVLEDEQERWALRASIDAIVAEAYGLGIEQYKHVLNSFSHKSYPHAPDLCLARFDELKKIGIDAFAQKYDPYWEMPLNVNLPEPVILIPTSTREADGQHSLSFTNEPTGSARRATITHGADSDELYQKLRKLMLDKHQITNADAQIALGCTAAIARGILRRLVEEHYALVEGRGRSTRYVAVSST